MEERMLDYQYNAPKVSMYIYNVKGKNIFGSVKFKTKVKTVQDMLDEIKDVKKSLIKKYKTKKIFILKDVGDKEWMTI
jgi:hypothetical protein